MGVYAGVTDDYLTQSDQTRVADAVKKYSLWSLSKEGDPGRTPALDLNFAENKSLVDDISGSNLITFTRNSAATYVDSNGLISIASTDTPRFDHDPDTGESLGLLIEEERTNLIPESEDITGAGGWAGYGAGEWSITDNAATAPDGTNTAERWLASSSNGEKSAYWNARITATTVTQSIFVKPIGEQYAGLRIYYDTNDIVHITFDLTGDGSVTDTQTGSSSLFTDISSGIQSYPNGWYRIHATSTQPSRGSFLMVFNGVVSASPTLSASGSENYAGDGTTGYYLWGAQLEEGSFPTSYIPTSGATATRAPDIVDITGTNFSSWYNQSEGTVYVSQKLRAVQDTDRNNLVYLINGGSGNDYFYNTKSGDTNIFVFGDGGTNYSRFQDGTDSTDTKTAWAYDVSGDDFKPYYNGIESTNETDNNTPSTTSHTQLELGATAGDKYCGNIKRLTYWTQRLQNSTLQSITE